MQKFFHVVKIGLDRHFTELSANSTRSSLWVKASYHGSGKDLEKQSSISGLQNLQYADGICIFGEFWNAVEFIQMYMLQWH